MWWPVVKNSVMMLALCIGQHHKDSESVKRSDYPGHVGEVRGGRN
jgi:hypothetical protein